MEYAACTACNEGTRGSDAVAAFMARVHPDNGESSWQAEEMLKLISSLDTYAPGVREELSEFGKSRLEWGCGGQVLAFSNGWCAFARTDLY
jgi:hypothetical protein